MLPAFQTDRSSNFGGEGIYQIDATGSKIIADTKLFSEKLSRIQS